LFQSKQRSNTQPTYHDTLHSASIFFEKAIKLDPIKLSVWERNFQLALGSVPVYIVFIAVNGGGSAGFGGGWSWLTLLVAFFGAAGGLLVALSIKYGDSILKTLATTSAIVLSSILDNVFLGGPLTPIMVLAGLQVILSICDYTFDQSVESDTIALIMSSPEKTAAIKGGGPSRLMHAVDADDDEGVDKEHIALMEQTRREA
jgi:hypothetical protein